jgi:hypothetical protein
MATIDEKLEQLFARVRLLPEDRKQVAVHALAELTERYHEPLAEELAALRPALEDAMEEANLEDAELVGVLNKPWA